jgi:ABC-2 type transport system ATP-binding protein
MMGEPGTRPATETAAIDIRGLRVSYGPVQAVREVTLAVQPGEVVGVLGPNGAGKTTTLSVSEGLLAPSGGQVQVLGRDVRTHTAQVKRLLGISLQTTAYFDHLRAWELVQFYAGMYGQMLDKAATLALLTRFDLADKAESLAQQLSGGQQQRLALAVALANDPQIVILDEPTTGLDPQARRAVWASIREIRAEGRTVLLTTHYMEEAQELCDRVAIIDRGAIIALDTPGGLIHSLHAGSRISVTARLPEAEVRALPGVTAVAYEGSRLVVDSTDAQASMIGLQRLAADAGQLLTDLSVKQPDLDDVFIALTGRKIQ